ncbi:MAG TPA: helix-turn-helix domain-containing protein [Pyrinomonadaceae bacterium]|nr:helix-turn-helix domain-containing protein [Pyrinomonadaceae bacterium]
MLEQRKHYAPERAQAEPPSPPAPDPSSSALKLKTMKELALALLREVESIKGEESYRGRARVNFAEAVREFETDLIRWALMHTGGHQRRAARLLDIKVTTLNAKIKRYGIRPQTLPHSGANVVDFKPESRQDNQ